MVKHVEAASVPDPADMLALTTRIVAAHVSRNALPVADLPRLIGEVYRSLQSLGGAGSMAAAAERPEPAVSVKKSVTPEYIICLEDGRRLKMLKRHLMAAYNLTPAQYRERWGLPPDYPMVAPAYAKHRSKLAKDIGLGKSRSRSRG